MKLVYPMIGSLALALAACGSKPAPTAPPPQTTQPSKAPAAPSSAETIARMREFRDAACACADKTCTDAVTAQTSHWGTTLTGHDLDDADAATAAALTQELVDCFQQAALASDSPDQPQ